MFLDVIAFSVLLPYRFTLFSNLPHTACALSRVLLPYRFTLFSNKYYKQLADGKVLLPYRFTLFSNRPFVLQKDTWFYYLIDLHYSQTQNECFTDLFKFYYLIDLHYSQTSRHSHLLQ